VIVRAKVADAHRVPPALLGDLVLQSGDDVLRAFSAAELAPRWQAKIESGGRPIPAPDGGVLTLCFAPSPDGTAAKEDLSPPLALCGLAADGTPRWRTPLGFAAGAIFDPGDFHLERRGDVLLVGYEADVAIVRLPAK
jgi:hypothetical protein